MPQPFDLIVVGSGAGGSGAAHRCRQAGWQVAVADELPFGGTCALRGCDPKKVLVGIASTTDAARRLRGSGVAGEPAMHWAEAMQFKRSFVDPVPEARAAGYARAGITALRGPVRFVDRDRVTVGTQSLTARHFLLAPGAYPRPLDIPGEAHLVDSTQFLELDELPPRIAFIGGGFISFEFAHIARRAGSSPVILSGGEPLRQFDRDLVQRLVRHSREQGIEVRTDARATGIERIAGGGFRVSLHQSSGSNIVDADLVVHGAGRVPHTGGLDLARAGVEVDSHGGIIVDQFLRSVSNPSVYAAGDAAAIAGSMALTPVAGYQSGIVADNLLHGADKTPNFAGIPSVVFTIPPLAAVGLTEEAARRQGLDVRVKSEDTSAWYSSRRVREPCSVYKTIVDQQTDRVVGAHLLGPHADEVINLFGLAIRQGLSATALKHQLYAYPSSASDLPYML